MILNVFEGGNNLMSGHIFFLLELNNSILTEEVKTDGDQSSAWRNSEDRGRRSEDRS